MWPFIAILGGGFIWYGKDQVSQEAVKDSLQVVLKNSREMKQTSIDFYEYRRQSEDHFNILDGSVKVLDKSYVRTLQNQLKDKEEKDQYQKEKIEMLEEALKKNEWKIQYQ